MSYHYSYYTLSKHILLVLNIWKFRNNVVYIDIIMRMGNAELICLDLFHDIVDLTQKDCQLFLLKKWIYLRLAINYILRSATMMSHMKVLLPLPCPSLDMARQGRRTLREVKRSFKRSPHAMRCNQNKCF